MTTVPRSPVPLDDRIPAVVAARADGLGAVLARCGIDGHVSAGRVVRHHPGSRCVIDVTAGGRRYALKCFKRDPAEHVIQLERLAAAGFANSRGPSITVVVGHSSDLACFVSEWFAGPTAHQLLERGDGVRLGEITAAWFAAARRAPPDLAAAYGYESLIADLRHWQESIATADAGVGARSAALIDALISTVPSQATPGLLHRSFSLNHLVDLGDGVGVLDWDEPAYGALECDAGAFVASLSFAAITTPDRAATAALASRTFRAIAAGTLVTDSMSWAARAAAVKRAKHVCKVHAPGWHAVADAVLAAAERRAA